jgi:hypothetical protein
MLNRPGGQVSMPDREPSAPNPWPPGVPMSTRWATERAGDQAVTMNTSPSHISRAASLLTFSNRGDLFSRPSRSLQHEGLDLS